MREKAEESLEHVILCPHLLTQDYRQEQLQALWTILKNMQTPEVKIDAILHGFNDLVDPLTMRSRPSTFGSLHRPDILLKRCLQRAILHNFLAPVFFVPS